MTGTPSLATMLTQALAWWQEAGVDCDFVDTPQDWLEASRPAGPAARQTAKRAAAPPPPVDAAETLGGGRANWPMTLAEFAPWWLAQPDLAPAGLARCAPVGPTDPEPPLMVLVAMPAADDGTSLLSGAAGKLLDGFCLAAGLARAQVYCASMIPARIAAPDWAALAGAGFGTLAAHHVTLVRPQQLIVFGQNGISALLGNDSPNSGWHLLPINHGAVSVPVMSAYDLETIMARPALKARMWERWLDGTA